MLGALPVEKRGNKYGRAFARNRLKRPDIPVGVAARAFPTRCNPQRQQLAPVRGRNHDSHALVAERQEGKHSRWHVSEFLPSFQWHRLGCCRKGVRKGVVNRKLRRT